MDNAFYAIKSIGSDQLSVPTLAANVEGEETTTAPNAFFNIPGSVNKRREKDAKMEE